MKEKILEILRSNQTYITGDVNSGDIFAVPDYNFENIADTIVNEVINRINNAIHNQDNY